MSQGARDCLRSQNFKYCIIALDDLKQLSQTKHWHSDNQLAQSLQSFPSEEIQQIFYLCFNLLSSDVKFIVASFYFQFSFQLLFLSTLPSRIRRAKYLAKLFSAAMQKRKMNQQTNQMNFASRNKVRQCLAYLNIF